MSSPIWKANDSIIAKGSRAKVISSDLSDGQNWVRVQYGGQEYEGYQSEFEVKGWRKLDTSIAVVGCGCLTLVGLVVIFGAILSGLNNSPQQQEIGGNSSSPVPSPVQRAVKPSPVPSPVQRTVELSPSPSLKPRPIRASQAGNCECPYDTDRAGRACGGRSAYSRLGGRSGAQCYTSDQ